MIMFAWIMSASLVHGSVKAPTQVPRTVLSCTCTLHLADLLFVILDFKI